MKHPLFKITKLIILLGGLFALLISFSYAQSSSAKTNAERIKKVIVEGKADGQTARSHDDALKEAKRRAVEQGVGVYVDANTKTDNYSLIYDVVTTQITGFISSYRILKEWKDDEFTYIKIEADVSLGALRDNDSAIKLMYKFAGSPKVMVIGIEKIDDEESDSGIVRHALEEKLLSKGITVIDQSQIQEVKERDVLLNVDDYSKTASFGKKFDADIVINYRANSSYAGMREIQGYDFYRYKSIITARIVYTDSAMLMGTALVENENGAAGKKESADNTLKDAGKALADPVLDKMLRGMPEPQNIVLDIMNVEYKDLGEIEKVLRKIRNVEEATFSSYTNKTASFTIKGEVLGKDVADAIANIPDLKIEIIETTPKRVKAALK